MRDVAKAFGYSDAHLSRLYQVGFSNVKSFSRAFKRLKGYMPSLIKKVKE